MSSPTKNRICSSYRPTAILQGHGTTNSNRPQMRPPKPPSFTKLSILTSVLHPPPPPPPRFSLLADKCTSMHQLKQIHAQMIVSARIHDNYAASRLLSFCALSESGDLSYALRLFNNTQEPNSFMWNTLIRAHASSLNPSEALLLYVDMRRLDVIPDLNLHVVNGLVRAYSVSCDVRNARRVFDEVSERSLSIWTTMISGYAQNYCSNEALELFDQMIVEGLEPNGATLASVLSACAQSGCLDLGERIHVFMEEKGIEVGVILGTALVHMYAKNGAILMAQKLFDTISERNTATWNAMICGLAVHGHAKEALDRFWKLEKEQIVPNDITFVGVLSACCHAGLLSVGRKIFHLMKRVYGIEPKIEHYGCMVDLLGRGGELLEAEELIKGMAWKADVVILGALLGSCKNHGNIEIAERVVKEILVLEPHNHGVYVVLSNMYAEAGRWEDVLRLRKVMKSGNLKKTPGWSLVDSDN
ncbi:pentatricopeptide repeat-containing protein At5g56310 [Vitis vinifera]|uniref:pentatricopeptide repeat-containing protein At5g56310 n=1 Tax=Vitis vinifera TaxID=29760 RepID=UPI00053F9CDB|nr:pentatricopeptide repeat-containing protein At5g56310 [Vitis vinifera]|eukprot:XP_010660755.1 PREDICTED: pentatricopeptide repeat-containing protein At5g56310-like [Vitis vinifera]